MPHIPPTGYTDPRRQVVDLGPVERVVGHYLIDHLGTAAQVYTRLPAGVRFTPPVVRLNRTGGVSRLLNVIDAPVVDLDVWSVDPDLAESTARRVRSFVLAMRGVMHLGLVVTRVDEQAGLSRRPEDDATLTRYGMSAVLLTHPA